MVPHAAQAPPFVGGRRQLGHKDNLGHDGLQDVRVANRGEAVACSVHALLAAIAQRSGVIVWSNRRCTIYIDSTRISRLSWVAFNDLGR